MVAGAVKVILFPRLGAWASLRGSYRAAGVSNRRHAAFAAAVGEGGGGSLGVLGGGLGLMGEGYRAGGGGVGWGFCVGVLGKGMGRG